MHKADNQKTATEFTLVKGTYAPEEAMEIISHLIQRKISFHELRNFSEQIRTGNIDQISVSRIDELNQSHKSLQSLVRQAIQDKKSMQVISTIIINLI